MISQANVLAGIFAFALGIAILVRSPSNRLYQTFALLCAAIGSVFISILLEDWQENIFWERMRFVSLAVLVPTLLRFFRSFPEELKPKNYLVSPMWLGASLILLSAAIFPENAWTLLIADTVVLLAMLRSLALLSKQYRSASIPNRRERLKILLYISSVTVMAILAQQIPDVPALGTLAVSIFLYFLSQALLYYRLLDLKEILGRGIVFAIQAVILTGVFSLVSGTSKANQPIQFFLFNALLAASVIVILFEPLRKLCEKITKQIFSRRHFEFEQLIQEIRQGLPSQVSEEESIRFVLDHMQRSGRTTHLSIYLLNEDSQALRLRGQVGEDLQLPQVLVNPRIMLYLHQNPKALILENLERQMIEVRQKEPFASLSTFMQTLHAQVTLPMIGTTGQVMGLLNLRDRGVEEAYSISEIRLLMTLAGQLATGIRNLKLYNELLEKDRLLALGEMAAGLAHEIRNPLGAIKGAAQYLKKNRTPNGSPEKFLGIIVEETDRLNNVLEHFLDFARAEKLRLSLTPIKPLLEHTVSLLSANGMPADLKLTLHIEENLPELTLDAERMKQVFLNLAMNAMEAVPQGGSVFIGAKRLESGHVEISFSDTGKGLQEENPKRVFAPFYTTKERGSGLGLAICQRIILDHGGEIEAINQGEHGGATFRIRLHPQNKGISP